KRGEVRFDLVVRLGAPERYPEPGHDFIEYEHAAILIRYFAQCLQKSRNRRNAVHVTRHRLDDDAGNLLAMASEELFDRADIVVGQNVRQISIGLGYAKGVGLPECERSRTCLDQQPVHVSVIAALELHDLVTTGITPGQTDGAHGCFGSGSHQTDLLDRRHQLTDGLRDDDFCFGRGAIAQTLFKLALQRRDNSRVSMTENQWPPRANIIYVAIAIRVGQPGAFSPLKEQGIAADTTKRANGRIDPSGNDLAGLIKKLTGTFCVAAVSGD